MVLIKEKSYSNLRIKIYFIMVSGMQMVFLKEEEYSTLKISTFTLDSLIRFLQEKEFFSPSPISSYYRESLDSDLYKVSGK
jgi:hypothetical protein